MAANDKFLQVSGNPGATIQPADVGMEYWLIQNELGAKVDPAFWLTTTGEIAGSALGDLSRMPWVEVWVSEPGDDRVFTQISASGHVLEDTDGFRGPPSGYNWSVHYSTVQDLWFVRIIHGGLGDDDSAIPDFYLDPEVKRMIWIHIVVQS